MSSLAYGEQGAFLSAVVSFHSGSVSRAEERTSLITAGPCEVSFCLTGSSTENLCFCSMGSSELGLDGFSALFFMV